MMATMREAEDARVMAILEGKADEMERARFGIQLGLLIETSGRVQTAVGRVMRWGLGAVDVRSNESNRDALLRDLDDMKACVGRVERALVSTSGELPVAPVVQGKLDAR